MAAIGGGMSRFETHSLDRLHGGERDWDAREATPIDRTAPLQWLGLCGLAAIAAVVSCLAFATSNLREGALLAAASILALAFGLLLAGFGPSRAALNSECICE